MPFCQVHCPLHNNIPDWLKLTAEGRLEEAYELSSATNNMPEICGRICPQDRLCEGNCVIEQSGHGTVTIGAVEKYITDTAWERGWVKPVRPLRELPQSVGIIGAGPAGLAAAEELRRRGYAGHVYDRYDRVGGLLIYGIPNFKLEKDVVERRAELLRDGGVHFQLDCEVGRDAGSPSCARGTMRCCIATGVYKARDIGGAGRRPRRASCRRWSILTASNRKGLGDAVPAFDDGTLERRGKHVVVVGGGDTAMDCVRTAVRQGAKSVHLPLPPRPRQHAGLACARSTTPRRRASSSSGSSAPEAFAGRRERVEAVRAHRMRLGVADATGRQTPESMPGSAFKVEADLVIKALGFDPEDLPTLFGEPELKVSRWGTVRIDWRTMMTACRACSRPATSSAAPRSWSGACATGAMRRKAFTSISRPMKRRPAIADDGHGLLGVVTMDAIQTGAEQVETWQRQALHLERHGLYDPATSTTRAASAAWWRSTASRAARWC